MDISLPRSETRKNSLKGFGFVQFATREEAVKAVEEGNGMKLNGRVIVVDLALPKFQFDTLMDAAKQVKAADGNAAEGAKDNEKEEDDEEDDEDEEKDEGNEEEDENEDEEEEEDEESDEDMDVESADLSDEGSEDDESDSDSEDDKPKAKKAKTESHDTVEGRTIFLRNLLFETVEDEVKAWSVPPFSFLFLLSRHSY